MTTQDVHSDSTAESALGVGDVDNLLRSLSFTSAIDMQAESPPVPAHHADGSVASNTDEPPPEPTAAPRWATAGAAGSSAAWHPTASATVASPVAGPAVHPTADVVLAAQSKPSASFAYRPTIKPRRGWQIATAGACLASLGLGGYAVLATNNASAWHKRTLAARQQTADVNARLVSSEADAKQLESRVGSLANEKAQVEDQRQQIKQATMLSQQVSNELDQCISKTNTLIDVIVHIDLYDLTSALNYAQQVGALCSQARTDNTELSGAIHAYFDSNS